jgi:tudor domain-containing protein 3
MIFKEFNKFFQQLEGPCVVQVVKMKNLAAPKDNENSNSAPPFYKVTLTDGVANCNALVMDEIANLNLETAPGTKLLLKGTIKAKTSSLVLNSQVCQVLGGVVEHLYSKWKATKDLTNHVRTGNNTGDGAAPVWVPFGAVQTNKVDTSKKTLQQNEMPEDSTSEFSQQRQAALAEAMQDKLKINKTFMHQTVDKPAIVTASTSQPTYYDQRQSSAPSNNPVKSKKCLKIVEI